MADREPVTQLDARYSSEEATPTAWTEASTRLDAAKVYWLCTVRPDGRPHVTPLLSVWVDDALYFCTGPHERKNLNLARSSSCVLLTGCNTLDEGVDVVIEGDAQRVSDEATLRRVADAYETKYGPDWHFDVCDGAFSSEGGTALVYQVVPVTGFGFAKQPYGQTRWRFGGH
jgi:nitroimidazol reductase NimA-like FMN-containing flavoprotein (pyridoxamine 5'-phosphate oxidase superfamily)